MTLTVTLTPEVEAGLQQAAANRRIPIEDFVASVVAAAVPSAREADRRARALVTFEAVAEMGDEREEQYPRVWHSNVKSTFDELAEIWKADTALLSSVYQKALHPAYQRIIGLGEPVVPILLDALARGDYDEWYWALRAITGEDPVSDSVRGNVEQMAEAWMQWGKKKGCRSSLTRPTNPDSQTSLNLVTL